MIEILLIKICFSHHSRTFESLCLVSLSNHSMHPHRTVLCALKITIQILMSKSFLNVTFKKLTMYEILSYIIYSVFPQSYLPRPACLLIWILSSHRSKTVENFCLKCLWYKSLLSYLHATGHRLPFLLRFLIGSVNYSSFAFKI